MVRPDNKGEKGDCYYMVGNEVNGGRCVDRGSVNGVLNVV